jgi:hypothetical protein
MARIALSGLSGDEMAANIEGLNDAMSLSDLMHSRLIAVSTAMAELEMVERPEGGSIWDENDWRDFCDWVANQLNEGKAVTRAMLTKKLK